MKLTKSSGINKQDVPTLNQTMEQHCSSRTKAVM